MTFVPRGCAYCFNLKRTPEAWVMFRTIHHEGWVHLPGAAFFCIAASAVSQCLGPERAFALSFSLPTAT